METSESEDADTLINSPRGDEQILDKKVKILTSQVTFLLFAFVVLLVTGILSFLALKYSQDHNVDILEENLKMLQTKIDGLTTELSEEESNYMRFESSTDRSLTRLHLQFSSLKNETSERLNTVNKDIFRLGNHSNEEVLGELELTKQTINTKLKESEQNVQARLHDSVATMESVVFNATKHIQLVEGNVTHKLAAMNTVLSKTASDLSQTVEAAQRTIHSEVETVRDSIQQYVVVTNQQFAAENDFVKYQLAGEIVSQRCPLNFPVIILIVFTLSISFKVLSPCSGV